MPHRLRDLLARNRDWARSVEARRPGFFTGLLAQQAPQYLWIGCADSRVPANEILGLLPGDVFVHRNVANVVVHSDLNALSVMQYAIDELHVRHVIVVGHYGCGGVTAALLGRRVGLVDNWLRHVQDVRSKHRAWLDALRGDETRLAALCELNVLEQALNVCGTTVVQDAWARGQDVVVHGWVYGLHDGLLQDLEMTVQHTGQVDEAYARALAAVRRRYDASSAAAALVPPPTAPHPRR
ncbi:MAG: carbonate dehydratase [Rubrivivax sp.]|jgi:carbonic anhydrase|nr:carbonate dehydratase [Rubrivivax sp.]